MVTREQHPCTTVRRRPLMAVLRGKPKRADATGDTTEPNPLLEAALEYARRGWAVLPLKPRSKTPIGTKGVYDATSNADMIIRYWSEYPDANVGIRTGEASNLVVIDVDAKPGKRGDRTLASLIEQYGPLPTTAEVFTSGRGRHYYFKYADMTATGPGALGPDIDVQSEGGYVVAPPSIHPDGPTYVWEASGAELADLPDWLVTLPRPKDTIKRSKRYTYDYSPPNTLALTRSNTSGEVAVCGGEIIPVRGTRWAMGLDRDISMAQALGLPVRPDGGSPKFRCILPGHGPDASPSAALFLSTEGPGAGRDILYKCFHQGETTLTLPMVRASLARGAVTLFKHLKPKQEGSEGEGGTWEKHGVEHLTWRLRLLYEAGRLRPLPVEHRPLPDDAPADVKTVYAGFLLLLGLKWHVDQWRGNGTAFSWQFAAPWCGGGLTEWRTREAIRWLLKEEYTRTDEAGETRYRTPRHLHWPRLPVNTEELPYEGEPKAETWADAKARGLLITA
jgi:hypothetical protein